MAIIRRFLSGVALRLLVTITVIGWVLGCGLISIAKWHWLGDLAAHFQPLHGTVGLLLSLALLLQRRRRLAIAITLIAGYLLFPMVQFLPIREEPESVGEPIRVATMNMHRDRPENLRFREWFARHDPDVIAFQEVSEPTARALRSQLRDHGTVLLLPATFEDWTPGIYGQVFFSRYPIRSAERIHDGWFGSGLFDIRLGENDLDLHVISGHPIRPGSARHNAGRDQALARMASLATGEPSTVVLGDLNTTSFTSAFGQLLKDGRLSDSRVGIGWQPSFSPFDQLPVFFPILAIDHVLLGSKLVTLDRMVTESIGSDHWPVIADIARSVR